MISVVAEQDIRGCAWRSKLQLRPLVLAVTIAIDVFPSLSCCEGHTVDGEAYDWTITGMKPLQILIKGASSLGDVPKDREGDPWSVAGELREGVVVNVLYSCIYLVDDESPPGDKTRVG